MEGCCWSPKLLIPAWEGVWVLFSLERYTSLAKSEETAGRFQDAMCCSCCFQVIYATAMWQEQCAVLQLGSLLLKDRLLLCSLEVGGMLWNVMLTKGCTRAGSPFLKKNNKIKQKQEAGGGEGEGANSIQGEIVRCSE